MTTISKILAISLLATACGGAIDANIDDQDDLSSPAGSYEPMDAASTARDHANRYGKNCAAWQLQGNQSNDKKSYTWTWTFECDGRLYVDVNVSPSGARVKSHQLRPDLFGAITYDPSTVNVSATDLIQLLAKAGYSQPGYMSLTAPLSAGGKPRWSVVASRTPTAPASTLYVDGSTGNISK